MQLPIELQNNLSLVIICSVIAYGVTQIVKPFLKGAFKDKDKARSIVRLCSVLVAALVGYTLGWEWFHLWLGAGAGVLNAWVVQTLKARAEIQLGLRKQESKAQGKEETTQDSDL